MRRRRREPHPGRRARWAWPLAWLLLALGLWAGQLLWVDSDLAAADPLAWWGRYWHWRAIYRPGIAAAEGAGGLLAAVGRPDLSADGGTFHPLGPTSATRGFAVAAALYALLAATAVVLGLRLGLKRRPPRETLPHKPRRRRRGASKGVSKGAKR